MPYNININNTQYFDYDSCNRIQQNQALNIKVAKLMIKDYMQKLQFNIKTLLKEKQKFIDNYNKLSIKDKKEYKEIFQKNMDNINKKLTSYQKKLKYLNELDAKYNLFLLNLNK